MRKKKNFKIGSALMSIMMAFSVVFGAVPSAFAEETVSGETVNPEDYVSDVTGEKIVGGVGEQSGIRYVPEGYSWDGNTEPEKIDGEDFWRYTMNGVDESLGISLMINADPMLANAVEEGYYEDGEAEKIAEKNAEKIQEVLEENGKDVKEKKTLASLFETTAYAAGEDGIPLDQLGIDYKCLDDRLEDGATGAATYEKYIDITQNGETRRSQAYCMAPNLTTPDYASSFKGASIIDCGTNHWYNVLARVMDYGYPNAPYTYLETDAACVYAGAPERANLINTAGSGPWLANLQAFYASSAQAQQLVRTAEQNANDGVEYQMVYLHARDDKAYQNVLAVYKKTEKGSLKLAKKSAEENITGGNDLYSLAGAVYGIYTDEACTQEAGRLTTGENGETGSISLKQGNYFIKEISSPGSFHLNPNVKAVSIKAGEDQTVALDGSMAELPLKGKADLLLQKGISGEAFAQGNTALSGVRFRVKYFKGNSSNVNELAARKADAEAVFATDEKGALRFSDGKAVEGNWPFIEDGKNVLPLGSYSVTEESAPAGLIVKSEPSGFKAFANDKGEVILKNIDGGSWTVIQNAPAETADRGIDNDIVRGGVRIVKEDAENTSAQGDASLAGAEFTIYNQSKNPVVVDRKKIGKGEAVMTVTAQMEDGKAVAKTAADALVFGTYSVKETKAPAGYLLNSEWTETFEIKENGQNTELKTAVKNPVVRGGVQIAKVSREGNTDLNQGEASLAGAKFEIRNLSAKEVVVDGKKYKPGETVMTITTAPVTENGKTRYIAKTAADALPYGKYSIKEVQSSTGYLLDSQSKQEKIFSIGYKADGAAASTEANGQTADLTGADTTAAQNQVLREDFSFLKKANDSGEAMGMIPFALTSKTTGESHIIVTDENGRFDSEAFAHSSNTNANDPDSPLSNGAVIKNAKGEYTVADESKLNPEAGVWFTGYKPSDVKWNDDGKSYTVDGKTVAVNDSLRAMPYDIYELKELRTPSNKDYDLITATVTLHRYTSDHDGPGINLDYGTLDDNPGPAIATELAWSEGGKVVPADSTVSVRDSISFENLKRGTKYTLEGTIHLVDRDGRDQGVIASASKDFTAKLSTGKEELEFENIDTKGLGGCALVCFESLYQGENPVANHADLTDADQTVLIPEIGTALRLPGGGQEGTAEETIVLEDTVSYRNLEKGKTYTVTGTLHIKNVDEDGNVTDGGIVKDADGKEVTAEAKFKAEDTKGEAKVTFKFKNPGNLGGKDLVAYEEVKKGDIAFAVHADINDEGQTVHYPGVETTASDAADGDQEIPAGADVTVQDMVRLTNLTPGNEYTVRGTLHLKNVDKDGNVTDGGILTDRDGRDIEASLTFTADKKDMEVALTFQFNTTDLGGKDIVVFEDLTRDDILLATHADITDEGQTVHVPEIGTEASDVSTGTHTGAEAETVVIRDAVEYRNLIKGTAYKVEGKLHVQKKDENGNITDAGVLLDREGKEVAASAEFVAEDSNGTVELLFEFKKPENFGGSTLVAFEDLKKNDVLLATHADITDEGQSVHFPKIGTTLSDKGGSKEFQPDQIIEMTDAVSYENLVPGQKYLLEGKLVKSDGTPVKGENGEDAVVKGEFIPDKPYGKTEVTFRVDTSGLNDGDKIVAFEYLKSENGTDVAKHEDLTDENQTVTIRRDAPPQTGLDGGRNMMIFAGAAAAAAAAVSVFAVRKKVKS